MDSVRRSLTLAVALALAATVAACGARLTDREVAAVEGASPAGATGAGGGGGGGEATPLGPAGGDATASGPTGAAGGGTGQEATGAETGGGGADAAGGPAPAAPPGGNGGATDVGVTGTRIAIGNVSTISGPAPGLFAGGLAGVRAWAAYTNSQGGIHGRRFQVLNADDNLDGNANRSRTREMAGRVLAFVGSTSGVDGSAAEVLGQTGVPDIGLSLLPARANLPNNFSPGPVRSDGYTAGPFNWFKEKFPGAEKKAALFWHNQATSKDNAEIFKKVMESAGYTFVYKAETSPTEPNYTGHVLEMRSQGVRFVFTVMEVNSISRLAKAMHQQNFDVDVPDFGPQAYSQRLLDLAGPAAEGTTVNIPHAMAEDAGAIPEMALFLEWMKRTAPGLKPDIFALYGWASGRLFEQALRAAGPKATRESLLAELRKIDQFDGNGILAPAGPASKRAPTCFVIAQVADGKWRRVDPASGYICDKGGFVKVR